MKFINLDCGHLYAYRKDLFKAFKDNSLIMDCQNPYRIDTEIELVDFLATYVSAKDAMVLGITDSSQEFCYGYVIFDNIRCVADIMSAEMHLALAKEMWGKMGRTLFEDLKATSLFNIVYAHIPHIAVGAITVAKRMGFKKTGYIPKALPYVNSKGETKLYDVGIYVLDRTKERVLENA